MTTVTLIFFMLAHYRIHDKVVMNDLSKTPGKAVYVELNELCTPGYAQRHRNVPHSLKYKVCAEYGISRKNCNGKRYEMDHLIPLELGGLNGIENLWPQPYFPRPGAKEKDKVENWLHRQVCNGDRELSESQREISRDWYSLYVELTMKGGD